MCKIIINLLLVSFVLLLLSSIGWTQSQDSTKQTTKVKIDSTIKTEKKSAKIDTTKKQKFVDENGNGIDDRLEAKKGKGKRKGKRDKFIDQNGDGICDGRESAFGLKKAFRRRKGKIR